MAGLEGALGFTQPDANEDKPHFLAYTTARTTGGKLVFDVWNGATSATRVFQIDLAGNVTATSFVGALTGAVTGNVTGNASGSSGSCTGNAATATALATGRTINGVSFDGTANITVTAAAGTLSGATLAAGVTASSLTSVGTLTALQIDNININGSTISSSSTEFGGHLRITPYTGYDIILDGTINIDAGVVTGATSITSTAFSSGANQVVGAQGAAVADATDAASVILRLNDLLARVRTHGLIDT